MRLLRSSSNKMLFGVCGGLADYFGIDSTVVRIGFAITFLIGFGSPLLLYLVLALLMPKDY